MKTSFIEFIKRKLLFVFQSINRLKREKQLLINNESEVIDFNLKFVRIGDELKYFRTPKN